MSSRPHAGIRVAFRADASVRIGTGHVMRCLTLADELRRKGVQCIFACREHEGHLAAKIREAGHEVVLLPLDGASADTGDGVAPPHAGWLGGDWERDAADTGAALGDVPVDWLVVDHYALDARWESRMRRHCHRLMVIDDLADRRHEADVLLDQNLGRAPGDYASRVNPSAALMIGPEYALLRPEFARLRETAVARVASRDGLRRILVSMGGVDPSNRTGAVLSALDRVALPGGAEVVAVLGAGAPAIDDVRALAERLSLPCRVLVDVRDMAELMAGSDLAVGAAGSTSWERCALGVPSVVMVLADNQRGIAEALGRAGAAVPVDDDADGASVHRAVSGLVANATARHAMAEAALEVCDARGTERVAGVMEAMA